MTKERANENAFKKKLYTRKKKNRLVEEKTPKMCRKRRRTRDRIQKNSYTSSEWWIWRWCWWWKKKRVDEPGQWPKFSKCAHFVYRVPCSHFNRTTFFIVLILLNLAFFLKLFFSNSMFWQQEEKNLSILYVSLTAIKNIHTMQS